MTNIEWAEMWRALESLLTLQNAVLAGLAILVLLYFWGRIRRLRRPPEVFAFESNRGGVYVTSAAVAELVQKISLSTEGVARLTSRLYRRNDRLHVHLRIHLHANYPMREVSRKLEHRLAAGLQNTYGIENLEEIRIVVAGVVGDPDVLEDDYRVLDASRTPESEQDAEPESRTGEQDVDESKPQEDPERERER